MCTHHPNSNLLLPCFGSFYSLLFPISFLGMTIMLFVRMTMENSTDAPQKIKNRVHIWPCNPSPGCLPEKFEIVYSQGYTHPNAHCSVIQSGKDMKTTQVSFDTWLDKEDAVHIYNEIPLSHRKDETLPFVTTWMDHENIMINEISQAEKSRAIWFHSPVEYKTEINKWTNKKKKKLCHF